MGEQAVRSRPRDPWQWKLSHEHAPLAQGIVVSAFKHLPYAEAIFLRADKSGGNWLRTLLQHVPITAANGRRTQEAATVAFTWSGLKRLNLDEDALASFSIPFQEGMQRTDRRRRLGDIDNRGEPSKSVIEGGPIWSANLGSVETKHTVHALLLLYGAERSALDERCQTLLDALAAEAVAAVHRLGLWMGTGEGGNREHFGFADGMSQPIPYSLESSPAILRKDGSSSPMTRHPQHGIAAGDILFGHLNAHGEPAPGPLVAKANDEYERLASGVAPAGFRDIGQNGSYLVVREMHQNVAGFWKDMDEKAAVLGETADWLASRIVGRTRDGAMLTPGGENTPGDNDFGFFAGDRLGQGCPMGSHVRRANPRDAAAPNEGAIEGILKSTNNHRILRRGRNFGPSPANLREDDGQRRGLLFMCLNTDIARQFEFIQQTWLMNQGFATLDEFDPLVGWPGAFTIQGAPVRLKTEVDAYVKAAGGEYFFLPPMNALIYLSELPAKEGSA